MALEALAPWAEPVLLTAQDLMARSDDGWRYELVHGLTSREEAACQPSRIVEDLSTVRHNATCAFVNRLYRRPRRLTDTDFHLQP